MSDLSDSYYQYLTYTLSLPERTVRSLAAILGGISVLLTDTLFPEALRDTTSYTIFVGNFQNFIVEKIAQIEKEREEETGTIQVTDDFLQRKLVGSILETAGLLTIKFSPTWVFAIAGDVVGGSKIFLNRLVAQLKENHVISEEAHITNLTDLLEALQDASRTGASLIDTPPLSRTQLNELVNELTDSYHDLFDKTSNLLPRFESLWDQMQTFSIKEHIAFERLVGMMTLDVAGLAQKGVGSTIALGETSGILVGDTILESYAKTLDAIENEGEDYITKRLDPFIDKAFDHFSPTFASSTETLLGRRLFQLTPTQRSLLLAVATAVLGGLVWLYWLIG
ncbi:MAG: hypothetical protein AAF485_31015 [Chloroflexota bacterium]